MVAVLTLVSAGGAVSAAAPPAPTPAPTYTTAQLQALQALIDTHLHDYGAGRQVRVNQIAFDDGRTLLTFPLPGEPAARTVDEPMTALGTANCTYLYACLWSDTNYNGTRLSRTTCDVITLTAPFTSSTGSIHNNQTNNTQTILYNSAGQILNANQALSKINDTGVGTRPNARTWRVC